MSFVLYKLNTGAYAHLQMIYRIFISLTLARHTLCCGLGRYQHIKLGCQPCVPGTICPVNTVTPTICPAGYYCSFTTQTVCTAGFYCPTGSPTPVPCPAGWYCPSPYTTAVPCGTSASRCLPFATSGGTISTTSQYRVHAFLSSDTIVFQADTTASVLAVGGGGGGGSRASGYGAGGGGGGALIFYPNYTFVAGSYYAKIGSGGTGGNCNYGRGGNTSIILSGSIMTFNALGGGGDEYNTCWKTFPGGSLSGSAALYGGGANLVNVPTGANECAPGLLQPINIAAGVEQPEGSKYVFTSVGGGPCDINYETVYQQTFDSGAASGGGGGGAGGPGYPDGMTAPSGGLGLGLPIFSELFGAAFNNLSPDGTIAGGGSGQCHLNRMVRGDDLCVALSSGGGGMGGLQDTNEYENGYNGLPNTGGGGGAEYHDAGGFPGSGGSGVVLIAYTTGCSRAYDVPAQYCPAGSIAPATCPGDYYCPDPSQKLPCSGCPAGSNALQEFSVGCLAGSTYSGSGATPCTKCSLCDPGYYVDSPCTATSDTECAPCPANYQCSNGIKVACPLPSVSPVGSSTFLNCSCPAGTAGWVTDTDTALCTPCLPGLYCQGSSCQCGPDKK